MLQVLSKTLLLSKLHFARLVLSQLNIEGPILRPKRKICSDVIFLPTNCYYHSNIKPNQDVITFHFRKHCCIFELVREWNYKISGKIFEIRIFASFILMGCSSTYSSFVSIQLTSIFPQFLVAFCKELFSSQILPLHIRTSIGLGP